MSALLRGIQIPRRLFKGQLMVQKANIYSKPPKNKIGPAETVFALSVFALAVFGPAGWILHNIPQYKKRE
ncbi:COX8 domain-containing protein [Latimeria chalumnae]|uniref:COX8 domain-containing protein n=1 Tax=Latimeria chalumnae TaxID=7897 RepID=UPI00313AFFE6